MPRNKQNTMVYIFLLLGPAGLSATAHSEPHVVKTRIRAELNLPASPSVVVMQARP